MPAGQYNDNNQNQQLYHHGDIYYHDRSATAKILKSVKDQEYKIEQLTRELEAERQTVTQQPEQSRVVSETSSMTSNSSTEDTFQWGGPQTLPHNNHSYNTDNQSFGNQSKMSTHLLDSFMNELEKRGHPHFGEDNMNYLHEDSFGSPGGPYIPEHNSLNYQYTGGNINGGEGSIGFDHRTSPHSSRLSLQSAGSNRNLPRSQLAKVQNAHGSRSSLPHDSHPSDNYIPYSGQNRSYDDMRGSPLPPAGSPPPIPGEHIRSRNHEDDYPTSLARFGVDSYDNQLPLQSSNHIDSSFSHYNDRDGQYTDDRYRGPPDDRYGDPSFDEGRYQGDPPPEDSFYRQSPMLDKRGPPLDRYMNPPFDEDPRGPHPDDRFVDPHSDLYRRPPLDDSYQGPPPNDSYQGPPHDDSYRDHQDDRYRGYPDDSFHGPPHDRSIENPPNDSFQDPPHGLYPDNHPHEQMEDPYKRGMDDHRHDGLPPVRADPFADDPFQIDGRAGPQRLEDPYNRGPSPGAGSDRMGPGMYRDRPQFDHRDSFDPLDNRPPYEQDSQQEYPDEKGRPPYYDDEIPRGEAHPVAAGPQDDYHSDGRHTPSTDGRTMKWRRPDLQEVIDYLSHPSDMIKANAAAYLQHLCYNDDDIKAKTRGLDGLPPLVELLNSEFPEVHKNACGALKNLSYGKNNDDNKRAIKNAGGIPALVRLLRKTQDEDVRDTVTGVLWNLSSLEDLKKPIIDDGLAVLVNVVIIPHSGYDKPGMTTVQGHEPFTTIFRNVTGVLRNVSSVGIEARRKLRECHGLVNSLIHTLQSANEQNNIDNKPVENCMCILRNLTYRIQEVEDPEFFKKRNATLQRQKQPSKENTGCFGGGKKKPQTTKGKSPDTSQLPPPRLPPQASEYKSLWSANAVQQYLHLLTSSNPVTLEASCGALQNLAACDWQPAVEIRAIVRKEKGLPGLVDLLTYELDRVVCAAATALRNLSLDERNKELVGKYAMKQLISNLPQDNRQRETNDETVSAVLATLNEVIQHNQDFAKSFCQEEGVTRLMHIARNQSKFTYRTVKYAVAVLKALWKFKILHNEFNRLGYTEKDFNVTITARPDGTGPSHSNFSTPYNTLSRPMASQGYDDTTLSSNRGLARNGGYSGFGKQDGYSGGSIGMIQGHSNPALAPDQDHFIHGSRNRVDEIPMSDIGPGYAPIVERNHRVKPPVGGVPLLPNLPPSQPQPPLQSQSNMNPNEPLYAMVQKGGRRRPDDGGPPGYSLTQDGGQQGADSWV